MLLLLLLLLLLLQQQRVRPVLPVLLLRRDHERLVTAPFENKSFV